ncbi:hypothetical protein JOB18_033129 [Solea senegalensis]|uniref:Secreted protein n=1 Tax=Solea senegalensis TaxID=28829 RepID=A0AAV6S084_SOLSE|nr:hypothetical protein JOB18_033129 [Solea senegalensis]
MRCDPCGVPLWFGPGRYVVSLTVSMVVATISVTAAPLVSLHPSHLCACVRCSWLQRVRVSLGLGKIGHPPRGRSQCTLNATVPSRSPPRLGVPLGTAQHSKTRFQIVPGRSFQDFPGK